VINFEKENYTKEKDKNIKESQILIDQVKDLTNKNNILYNENKNLSDTIKVKESEIVNNLNMHQKEIDTMNKEMNLIKKQNNELQMNKKSLEEEIAYLKMQIDTKMNSINTLNQNQIKLNNYDNYEEIINELKESQRQLENDNRIKEQTIKQLKEEKEKIDIDFKLSEVKNKNLNEQISKLQNEVLNNTREDNLNEKLKESNTELKNQIEKQNNDINNLEKTNKELKSIITGIQNVNNSKDLNNEEQTIQLNETISKLQKDNYKLLKNLELFKQENHLAAEKIKKLESLISGK
jgi:chromosome segregation ATPase